MSEVHVSACPMCEDEGCVDMFYCARETQDSIQILGPKRHLHCVLSSGGEIRERVTTDIALYVHKMD